MFPYMMKVCKQDIRNLSNVSELPFRIKMILKLIISLLDVVINFLEDDFYIDDFEKGV